jgi:DNA-binding NarL/FixJ family response regulator
MKKEILKNSLVIIDDHLLFAESLERLINSSTDYKVKFHAKNGMDFIQKLEKTIDLPSVILLDVNMPVMNGFETMEWLTKNYPQIKVLILSMEDDEEVIIKMLRAGANGYLLKDIHPEKLKVALNEVVKKGYYHSDKVAETLLQSLQPSNKIEALPDLKENELTFIKLACTEMTYKEIAEKMMLSPKTIDGYRDSLFKKLQVKNRVGLVIYAMKHNLISI